MIPKFPDSDGVQDLYSILNRSRRKNQLCPKFPSLVGLLDPVARRTFAEWSAQWATLLSNLSAALSGFSGTLLLVVPALSVTATRCLRGLRLRLIPYQDSKALCARGDIARP